MSKYESFSSSYKETVSLMGVSSLFREHQDGIHVLGHKLEMHRGKGETHHHSP